MLIFTTDQLQKQGVSYQDVVEAQQIKCSGRCYSRVCNFPKTEQETAMDLCRSLLKEGIFSFVSDCVVYLTVWGEEKKELPSYKAPRVYDNFSANKVSYDILNGNVEKVSTSTKSYSYQPKPSKYEVVIREVKNEVNNREETVEKTLKDEQIFEPILDEPNSNNDSRIYRGVAYELKDSLNPKIKQNAENTAEIKKPSRVYRGISY